MVRPIYIAIAIKIAIAGIIISAGAIVPASTLVNLEKNSIPSVNVAIAIEIAFTVADIANPIAGGGIGVLLIGVVNIRTRLSSF